MHPDKTSINGIRAGSISALGADQNLVDHGNRAVAPDLKQEDLARGGDPARERRDVYLVGDQDNGFPGRKAEQELPEFGGLWASPVPVPEERVQRGQVRDRTEVEESGRVAAAAPLAGDNAVDGRAGGVDRRPDLSRLFPTPGVEIALGGAIVELERCGGRCHVNHRVTSLWAPTPEIMQRSSLAATVSSRRRGIGGVFGGRPDGVGR